MKITVNSTKNQVKKYSVNCDIQNRTFDRFGGYSFTPKPAERMESYNRDIQDTLTELETIVTRYDKYGDPKALEKMMTATATLMTMPDTISFPSKMVLQPIMFSIQITSMEPTQPE